MAKLNEFEALDNEIKHETKLAIMDRYRARNTVLTKNDSSEIEACIESAELHEQRVKWLTELRELKVKEIKSRKLNKDTVSKIINSFASELENKDNINMHEIETVFTEYGNFDLACHIFREYVEAIASKVEAEEIKNLQSELNKGE